MTDLFGDEVIRTLGLYQPFAALIGFGKVETRFIKNGKKPPFPLGKYMIYSCQKGYDVFDNGLASISTPEQQETIMDFFGDHDILFTTFGEPLFIVDLVKIIDPLTPDIQNTFVNYIPPDKCYRRIGIVFENVKRIKSFQFRGKQGVGILTKEQKAQIEFI